MAFLLSRGGANVALEVQRWQYFLLTQNVSQVGAIDGQFGLKTENATQIFQVQHALPVTGQFDAATCDAAKALGYMVVPDDHYDDKKTNAYPPKPGSLASPDNASRSRGLGCFMFKQLPLANRADPDEVVMLGSCDGTVADWRKTNIIDIPIPQLRFASGFNGTVTCHRLVAPHIANLFAQWEALQLLHLVRAFDGTFSPRFKRGQSPGDGSSGPQQSAKVDSLSNHAFGSAMDVNAGDNAFNRQPVLCPLRGCVRELVEPANKLGFYWGGHFTSPKDGMHFEFADFDNL